MDQEIIDYITQAQKHGLTDFEIKQNLLNTGWEAGVVEQGFVFAKAAESRPVGSKAIELKTQNPSEAVFPSSKPVVAKMPSPIAGATPAATPMVMAAGNEHMQAVPTTKKSFFKKPLLWIVVVVLLLIGGGAYGYYNFILGNPTTIWDKFVKSGTADIYQTKFNFSYSDPGDLGDGTGLGFQLKDIKLKLDGSAYLNASDPSNPDSSSKIQYTFSSGNTSFSTGFEYILLDQILYLNIGDNPLLNAMTSSLGNGKKIEWIKIDLNQLKGKSSSSQEEALILDKLSNPDFKNAILKIWNDTTIVKVDKYVGREKLNNITTLHFVNTLDKEALKTFSGKYLDQIASTLKGTAGEIKDSDVQTAKEILAQLIDKVQVKNFETWVGMTDFRLYKVNFVTNAPSLISLVKNAQALEAPVSHDAKRLADVRQLASAMELYYNDYNAYPDSQNGKPIGLAPTYIGLYPTSPTPADGTCTDYYNAYWYEVSADKQDYALTFCLGSNTGGYSAGIAKLSSAGITSPIPCPTTPAQCSKQGAQGVAAANDPNAAMKKQVQDFIAKLDFSAEINISADYTDYGKKVDLSPPANPYDIMQEINQSNSKSGPELKTVPNSNYDDAKRLADIRQMASALELYFNDKNSYPDSLSQMAPNYIGLIPTAPTSTSNVCSQADNTYTYQKKSSTAYTLTF
ncbi:MAG TPA: hypothetical protein VE973_02825, partial [Candidatus Limnocylindria bacterium]|nr:hypothetical protein [Candidatus Limnocylindria bacterium]